MPCYERYRNKKEAAKQVCNLLLSDDLKRQFLRSRYM